MNFKIMTGDNRETLKTLGDNSVDAIVTDPPYGIDFLGKTWDANTGALETYTECLRVLKPGGYILAFSAARTYHHLAITLEQAGFEIRDQLMWLYASGFPKAQDIGKAIQRRQGVEKTVEKEMIMQGGFDNWADTQENKNATRSNQTIQEVIPTSPEAKQWEGWKTALKPAHEPICMARKPFKGSTIDNVLEHGVGALNIDGSRIGYENNDKEKLEKWSNKWSSGESKTEGFNVYENSTHEVSEQGRFPSNVLGEVEGYQKYFYCPKVSRKERHTGFEQKSIPTGNNFGDGLATGVDIMSKARGKQDPLGHIPAPFGDVKGAYVDGERMAAKHQELQGALPKNKDFMVEAMGGEWIDNNRIRLPHKGEIYVHGLKHEYELWCKANNVTPPNVGNNHPTVKPVALMKWLIKLVTPENSTVLDPFSGSGSTGMAAVELGHEFIGCELDENYVRIAEKRIRAWNTPEPSGTTYENLFEEKG